MMMALKKIISGGQTGADRGGLEAAIALGIPHGGYCPRGRLAEDGFIPHKYELTETTSRDYPDRTMRNIAAADATLIVVNSFVAAGPGSRLTIDMAMRVRKPCMTVELSKGRKTAASRVRGWLRRLRVETLNVAGSRESTAPGIEKAVRDLLIEVLHG